MGISVGGKSNIYSHCYPFFLFSSFRLTVFSQDTFPPNVKFSYVPYTPETSDVVGMYFL